MDNELVLGVEPSSNRLKSKAHIYCWTSWRWKGGCNKWDPIWPLDAKLNYFEFYMPTWLCDDYILKYYHN